MGEKQDTIESRGPGLNRGERKPGEIRSEIERTRAEMTETVDAIERKISPDRFRNEMVADLQRAGDFAQRKIREYGSGLVERAKTMRLPTALLLIGISWLIIGIARKRGGG